MRCFTCQHWRIQEQDRCRDWGICRVIKTTVTVRTTEKCDLAIIGDRESLLLTNKSFGCIKYECS